MVPKLQVTVDRKQWGVANPIHPLVQFWVFEHHGDGRTSAAETLTLVDIPEGAIDPEPTFRLDTEESQQLMDRLWDIGFRPSEGTGSAGAMAAVERHLKDLQKLVFNRNGDHDSRP